MDAIDLAMSKIDSLLIQKRLGKGWASPKYWGPEKYSFKHLTGSGSIVVSLFSDLNSIEWIHASIAWNKRMPTYNDLKFLHWVVFGAGWAYQVFTPPSDHINIHEFTLHLWGRVDGIPVLPDFAALFESTTGIRSV